MFAVHYHEETKHHFHRFARSLGYLDWETQPDPFRRFEGAAAAPIAQWIRELLRYGLGLSAWKQFGSSRWALRVNPSSGNLHPTEGYVVTAEGVFHYAPRENVVEQRCAWGCRAGAASFGLGEDACLVGLSSIHWREAWKYGERAFRYCQHDVGHAIGALRVAAALAGCGLTLLPRWSHDEIAALLGLDRDQDFEGVEREEPACLAIVTRGDARPFVEADPAAFLAAARDARWAGRANRLSPDRMEWPIVDEVARATRAPGVRPEPHAPQQPVGSSGVPTLPGKAIILRRRSALGFDASGSLPADAFISMLLRTVPSAPPWDALWWPANLHLIVFVHRVSGLAPGVYAFIRDTRALEPFRAACRPEFLWEPVAACSDRLFLLLPIDCRDAAERLACDQAIGADGFFSLAMLARFEPALRARGQWFYRHLFWEAGLIGQVLYLAAELAGARATGIGCFFDDAVHELLGLAGRDWQCLYEFSAGVPADDPRLTMEPGYPE